MLQLFAALFSVIAKLFLADGTVAW